MNSNILRKMFISMVMIAVSTVIFGVSVYAYYGLTVSNKNNVIKATNYGVDLTLYEKVDQIADKTIGEEPNVIYLQKVDQQLNVCAYDYLINKYDKDLYVEIKVAENSNADFKVNISQISSSDNSFVATIMSDTSFDNVDETEDKIETSIQKIYSKEETEARKVRVLTSKFSVDTSTIKQYVVKSKQSAPTALSVESKNSTSIILKAITTTGHGNVEYAISETNSTDNLVWQETTTFNNLTSGNTYYLFVRYAGDANYNPSDAVSITCTLTSKSDQEAPAAPTLASATNNSLTVNKITTTGHGDVEYAVNTTSIAPTTGWQTGRMFTELTEGTDYYFFARYVGDDDYNPAVSSGALLGLGYTMTIPQDFKRLTRVEEDLIVTYWNGDTDTEDFANTVDLDYATNVRTLYRPGCYIAYYLNSDPQKNILSKDFGDKTALVLTADITITQTNDGNCIDENTMITMWDGSLKAMKEIEIGDEVLSIDYNTMELVPRKVIYTSKNETNYNEWTVPCYYLHTFSDGTTIKRAMRHRFYNLEEQGYKHMDYWSSGLKAYKIDGSNPYLVSTEIIQEELHYARITLEGSNNYFANGLSTGDSECCPNKVTLDKKLERVN